MAEEDSDRLPLSTNASASLITCGPGDDFYTTFGHSALRITDLEQGLDVVYNYGTFDFSTPHFYWNFTRGQLDYQLSRTTYQSFMRTYSAERRAVWEQPLNLTRQEVCNLFLMLEWNHQPENRFYRYDFFRDNCATRVRDMIATACGKEQPQVPDITTKSYRSYLHQAMGDSLAWWALGIDILLGGRVDYTCTASDAMFYPLVMMQEYACTERNGLPLVGQTHTLLRDTREQMHRSFPPIVIFGFLFILLLAASILEWRKPDSTINKIMPIADRVLFVVAGVIGLFLIFMWTGTDHWCTKLNANILWASPLYIFVALFLRHTPRWVVWLQLVMLATSVVLLHGCTVAIFAIIACLALRTAMLLKKE